MRHNRAGTLLAILTMVIVVQTASAQLSLEVVVDSGLSSPLFVCQPPGDSERLFILQQAGTILIVENGTLLPTPFLDLSDRVLDGGERGLLGMAFHPDYETNGQFFVNYTAQTGSGDTVISRFTVSGDPDIADAGSEVILLTFDQPQNNHNAGMIAFSPLDGYLYICTGDGGSSNDSGTGHSTQGNAQDPQKFLGKILRIDVDLLSGNTVVGNYAIPADNPFVGDAGVLDEIWAIGLRNPYRFSFDGPTGDLFIGDVGQFAFEEISYQPGSSVGGENYGWRIFEGDRCNTDVETQGTCDGLTEHVPPVHTYENPPEPGTPRAVVGGYVYRGTAIPSLQGRYFFADASSGQVWSFLLAGGVATDLVEHTDELHSPETTIGSPTSFGIDNEENLYIVNRFAGVYRIVGPGPEGEEEAGTIIGPGRVEEGNSFSLSIDLPGLVGTPEYQWIKDDAALSGETDASYDVAVAVAADEGFYRARVTDASKTNFITEPFFVEVLPVGGLPVSGVILTGLLAMLLALAGGMRSARRQR